MALLDLTMTLYKTEVKVYAYPHYPPAVGSHGVWWGKCSQDLQRKQNDFQHSRGLNTIDSVSQGEKKKN